MTPCKDHKHEWGHWPNDEICVNCGTTWSGFLDARDREWGYGLKCECGNDKLIASERGLHSDWCPKGGKNESTRERI
jgi:hypothetical protein